VVVEGLTTGVAVVASPLTKHLPQTERTEGASQSMFLSPKICPSINIYPSIAQSHNLSGVVEKQICTYPPLSHQIHLKEIRPVVTIPTLRTPATQNTHINQKLKSKDWVEIRPGMMSQRHGTLRHQSQTVTYPSAQAMSSNLVPLTTKSTEQSRQTGSGPGWITLPTEEQPIDVSCLMLNQSYHPYPVGGRLKHFLLQWQLLIQDKFAKSVVKNGYQIDWVHQPPPLTNRVMYTQLDKQSELLEKEVQEMLQKRAIEQVTNQEPGFCSTFFLVPKKDSDEMRPVINLKGLNKFVKCPTFKMHSPSSIVRMIRKGNWLASIDLKDAYFHVPMHPRHYKFLRFAFQDKIYQFKVLPFGLSTAPRVFTKVLAPVVGFLHQQGIYLFPYLDDCLLVAENQEVLKQALVYTIQVLQSLGFLINFKKSHLQLTQRITFLGMEIDTHRSAIFLPRQKAEKLSAVAETFLRVGTYVKARYYLKFLGLMASTLMMVPSARLYMRPLQIYLNAHWNRKTMSLNHKVMIPLKLLSVIQWWSDTQNLLKGLEFPPKKHTVIVTTDASLTAWGAHCGSQMVQGTWNPHQQAQHINLLELLAVWNALKAFLHIVKNQVVLVQTDNTSVLHYINKSGGTRSFLLCQTTWEMLQWCITHNIELRATHIPGKDNKLADNLSRNVISHLEWELNINVANQLFHLWPTPTIDLFASFQNTKLTRTSMLMHSLPSRS
jgi:ribonuclease HI